MSKELVLHGWQLVWFALGNQVAMLAVVWFVMWVDKRRRACKTCGHTRQRDESYDDFCEKYENFEVPRLIGG